MDQIQRDHHHLPYFNLNLNGVIEAYVRARRCEEGILYKVIMRRVVYDHVEESVALSFLNECAADAVADAINMIVKTLARFDGEFARTIEGA